MAIPLLLIILAAVAAAVVAYGTHPGWGQFEHGLQMIVWSRRLEWPLVTLAIVLCVVLIGLVILGRRRAWWLIGLGPILALFVHHFAGFAPDRAGALAVVENPPVVDVGSARGLADDDWVVGVSFTDGDYAYPYASLFLAPVVIQSDRDNRMVLLWSAYANRVLAFRATTGVKGRDLEVVSTPANAPLIYDSRHGQFINGLKGMTLDGKTPIGFGAPLLTSKTTWKEWRIAHPDGKVMAWSPVAPQGTAPAPKGPILPAWPMPGARPDAMPTRRQVTVVGLRNPLVVESEQVTAAPANFAADGAPVLLFRPGPGDPPRAFDGRIDARVDPHGPGRYFSGPAAPRLSSTEPASALFRPIRRSPRRSPAMQQAAFQEVVSDTFWTIDGAGILRTKSAGKHLQPVPVDDNVDWDVLKAWYPDIQLIAPPSP